MTVYSLIKLAVYVTQPLAIMINTKQESNHELQRSMKLITKKKQKTIYQQVAPKGNTHPEFDKKEHRLWPFVVQFF